MAGWSIWKKTAFAFAALVFGTSTFMYFTSPGYAARMWIAETVITTQHREWAWIVVGAKKRDEMVLKKNEEIERSGLERQDLSLIHHNRSLRSADELVKVEDISGKYWKGKKMYVYDPTAIRVMVPNKPGEGERISSMVERTGAVAGINGGGFVDPDGLGNGFAPIGLIMSGFEAIYTDAAPDTPQFIVGFTAEGTLVVGKYSLNELKSMNVKEAVSFLAPRIIANGKGQIVGDGGWGRAPRTAIGQRADGTVIMVVIDGRQTHSIGATLREVQDLLLAEGAINAGFLDGGASSVLVTRFGDKAVVENSPSSRYGERRLPSGFLVFADPDSVQATRVWDGIDRIDPGGAHDHPDYQRELQEKKKKASASPKPSATPAPKPSSSPSAVTAKPSATAPAGGGSASPGAGADGQPTGGTVSPAAAASEKPGTPAPAGETNLLTTPSAAR
ncbi:phosphodiester glycosidase family protein [Paenibacillus thermoaerophilus]|nr:phosphodiester glycosidase family protein [Paenibacillus thermoaerophilus]